MADNIPVEGNLDLKGNQIKNGGFEVFSSLPTTYKGGQITYGNKVYTWDEINSKYVSDSDYLEIGGRKSILNSSFDAGLTGWQYSGSNTISIVSDGYSGNGLECILAAAGTITPRQAPNFNVLHKGDYICQVKIKTDNHADMVGATARFANRFTLVMDSSKTINLGDGWMQYFFTATLPSDLAVSSSHHFGFYQFKAGTIFVVDEIKLEHGNKATDWTPAPEDKADVNHDHDSDYLGISDTAADSDKLDGKHATDFAQLDENDKIKASNLPDYLLGQVLYGGSINASQTCTLSSLYKDKFNTTDTTRLLSALNASSHVGVYFIANSSFTLNGTIDVQIGDWVISDGNSWGKIDNTDAVSSVNNKTGVVNLGYEDLGDMPVATDTEVGGIMLGFVQGLDADLLDGKHATDFAGADHNHDYSSLDNLPDIYKANHAGVPTDDFDLLYDEPNDVWLCMDSMRNGPLDNDGDTNPSYNIYFDQCVVQQFGKDTKIQVLYITTGDVHNNIEMGSIFYRIQGDKWKRIVTHSDIEYLQTQINNLTTTVNNKQDKLSVLTDINIPSNGGVTINPSANNVQYINLSGQTTIHTINLNSLNSLDEYTMVIINPNNVSRLVININSSYKFVGVLPSWSYNSWVICIWRGMIFANILN